MSGRVITQPLDSESYGFEFSKTMQPHITPGAVSIIRDCFQINAPNAVTIGVITLSDAQAVASICLSVVSIACTIFLTYRKTRKKGD